MLRHISSFLLYFCVSNRMRMTILQCFPSQTMSSTSWRTCHLALWLALCLLLMLTLVAMARLFTSTPTTLTQYTLTAAQEKSLCSSAQILRHLLVFTLKYVCVLTNGHNVKYMFHNVLVELLFYTRSQLLTQELHHDLLPQM